MQAIFRFHGDSEIVISNQVQGVLVEILDGLDPATAGDHEIPPEHLSKVTLGSAVVHPRAMCTPSMCGCEPWPERRRTSPISRTAR